MPETDQNAQKEPDGKSDAEDAASHDFGDEHIVDHNGDAELSEGAADHDDHEEGSRHKRAASTQSSEVSVTELRRSRNKRQRRAA